MPCEFLKYKSTFMSILLQLEIIKLPAKLILMTTILVEASFLPVHVKYKYLKSKQIKQLIYTVLSIILSYLNIPFKGQYNSRHLFWKHLKVHKFVSKILRKYDNWCKYQSLIRQFMLWCKLYTFILEMMFYVSKCF